MDNKAIEEKAIICFKDYILDSKVISPFLNENDKEPCWDGHLYVYSDPSKSKKYLSGRVPVQIKGTIVKRFVTKKYKFSVDVSDLKAYKTEPTVYVVCQQKEHSKERMLFYRFFLPETVKNILKGKESQGSIKVLFHEMPQDVVEFENRIKVFIGDKQKQLSFVNGKPFTLDDAKRKHITSFTFLAPNANMNSMELMSYLSSHPSFLYAKVDESLGIEVPISNGPMSFLFQNTIDANISVNGKVFYNSYLKVIKDGKIVISIGDFITLTMTPEGAGKANRLDYKFESKATSLQDRIIEAEFVNYIHQYGYFNIGDLKLEVPINDQRYIEANNAELQNWVELRSLLRKLNVTKDFVIKDLTEKDNEHLNILVKTILKGQTLGLNVEEDTIVNLKVGNLQLLLWASRNKDGSCSVGDFFDGHISVVHQINDGAKVKVTPFSYLQKDNLWELCDNIPFDDILSYYDEIRLLHKHIYDIANYDILFMLKAYDTINDKNSARCKKLLKASLKLCQWLLEHNPDPDRDVIYRLNHLQIIKRERQLTTEELDYLSGIISSGHIKPNVKVGACLLAESKDDFQSLYKLCTDMERQEIESFPIWHFKQFFL